LAKSPLFPKGSFFVISGYPGIPVHVLSNKRVVMMCSTAHLELARLCYHKDDCSSRREISPYEPAGG